MSNQSDNDLDRIIWGALNIAIEAGLIEKDLVFDENGDKTPAAIGAERQGFYMLHNGILPGRKVGNQWTSTRRQIRATVTPDPAEVAERKARAAEKAA